MKMVCGATIVLGTSLNLCNRNAPPKKGARIPQPCSSSTVPTPSISTSVPPSQSSLLPLPGLLNLETQPSVPAPPSACPWALNLLQETEASHFLRTHVERVALSNAYAYAVSHQPFSTTLASIDIASLGPHVWVSGLAILQFRHSWMVCISFLV